MTALVRLYSTSLSLASFINCFHSVRWLDAELKGEMRAGCHLIVNSFVEIS